MPTYDYECPACGHRFEAFQKITDKPLAQCPKCKGQLRRLIGSGSGIIFKGSGFYATDYRKKPPACDKADSSDKCSKCPASKPDKDKK